MGKVTAVVGAQFGSEGKGAVVGYIANDYDVHVRTGSPNAGHTVWRDGEEYKMRQIPCGFVNRDAILVIGPGAVINPDVLLQEICLLDRQGWEVSKRLFVDACATVIEKEHVQQEGHTKGEIHRRIGSTGEGVGAARIDRLRRNKEKTKLFCEWCTLHLSALIDFSVVNTAERVNTSIDKGKSVLLEGTQGFGLSLTHGDWPYVTSHDTTAGQLCVDAGISPLLLTDVIMVARTFPIRVAGNSGPLDNEMSWRELSRFVGQEIAPERTTVTKLERRIGVWDENLMRHACRVNRPTEVVVTFMDYFSKNSAGVTNWNHLPPPAISFVEYIEKTFLTQVRKVGTGYSKTDGWTCAERV